MMTVCMPAAPPGVLKWTCIWMITGLLKNLAAPPPERAARIYICLETAGFCSNDHRCLSGPLIWWISTDEEYALEREDAVIVPSLFHRWWPCWWGSASPWWSPFRSCYWRPLASCAASSSPVAERTGKRKRRKGIQKVLPLTTSLSHTHTHTHTDHFHVPTLTGE